MKKNFLNILKITIFTIAVISANTPSQMGLFQPKIPKKLKV
jgi:cyclic lactone autoinducer peptide